MALATKVYEEQAKQNSSEENTSENTDKKDDVIDAEFEEK